MNFLKISCSIILLISACSGVIENKSDIQVTTEQSAFLEFVNSIRSIEPGYTYTSNDPLRFQDDLTSEFIPEGASLVGKLDAVNKKQFIIYAYPADVVLPILAVYNSEGIKISEHELFDYSFCTDLDGTNQFSRFTILKNGKIKRENLLRLPEKDEIKHIDTLDIYKL